MSNYENIFSECNGGSREPRKPEPQAQDSGMLMDIWEDGRWKHILVRWNGSTYVEVSK